MKEYLTFKLEQPDPISEGIFSWLSTVTGITLKKIQSSAADIYYGNSGVGNKITIRKNTQDIIWRALINGENDSLLNLSEVKFDIINAISSFLSDRVNEGHDKLAYDQFGRLKYNSSFQFLNNIGEKPIVNLYVIFLKSVFSKILNFKSGSFLPYGKKGAIAISHDVDKPMLFQFIRDFDFNRSWTSKEKLYHLSRYIYNSSKYFFSAEKKKMSDFGKIIAEESIRGFKSTFYFASNNGYSNWGSVYDTFYNIEWPEFKAVFKEIKENDFNIGLHASYNSYLSPQRFETEKKKLEDISEMDVIGLRHHYWHMGRDINRTLNYHFAAGFKYDSSVGFNDHIGFGRNCAIPFYPVYPEENKLIRCLQIPVFCMDGSLLYRDNSAEKAIATLKKYVNILKEYNGTASLNWHTETSFEQKGKYKNWADVYIKILDYLASDSEIWATSLEEVHSRFKDFEVQIHKDTV